MVTARAKTSLTSCGASSPAAPSSRSSAPPRGTRGRCCEGRDGAGEGLRSAAAALSPSYPHQRAPSAVPVPNVPILDALGAPRAAVRARHGPLALRQALVLLRPQHRQLRRGASAREARWEARGWRLGRTPGSLLPQSPQSGLLAFLTLYWMVRRPPGPGRGSQGARGSARRAGEREPQEGWGSGRGRADALDAPGVFTMRYLFDLVL